MTELILNQISAASSSSSISSSSSFITVNQASSLSSNRAELIEIISSEVNPGDFPETPQPQADFSDQVVSQQISAQQGAQEQLMEHYVFPEQIPEHQESEPETLAGSEFRFTMSLQSLDFNQEEQSGEVNEELIVQGTVEVFRPAVSRQEMLNHPNTLSQQQSVEQLSAQSQPMNRRSRIPQLRGSVTELQQQCQEMLQLQQLPQPMTEQQQSNAAEPSETDEVILAEISQVEANPTAQTSAFFNAQRDDNFTGVNSKTQTNSNESRRDSSSGEENAIAEAPPRRSRTGLTRWRAGTPRRPARVPIYGSGREASGRTAIASSEISLKPQSNRIIRSPRYLPEMTLDVKTVTSPRQRLMASRLNTEDDERICNELKSLLCCPVCLDKFVSPKVLSCHHTVCLSCLIGISGASPHYLRSYQTAVVCPLCRANHRIPMRGCSKFPDDFRINQLADLIKAMEARRHDETLAFRDLLTEAMTLKMTPRSSGEDEDRLRCDLCSYRSSNQGSVTQQANSEAGAAASDTSSSRLPSVATEYCFECARFMCPECANRHNNLPLMKDHFVCKAKPDRIAELRRMGNSGSNSLDLSTSNENPASHWQCDKHNSEPCQYVCLDLHQRLCSLCIFADPQLDSHRVLNFREAIIQHESRLRHFSEVLSELEVCYRGSLLDLSCLHIQHVLAYRQSEARIRSSWKLTAAASLEMTAIVRNSHVGKMAAIATSERSLLAELCQLSEASDRLRRCLAHPPTNQSERFDCYDGLINWIESVLKTVNAPEPLPEDLYRVKIYLSGEGVAVLPLSTLKNGCMCKNEERMLMGTIRKDVALNVLMSSAIKAICSP